MDITRPYHTVTFGFLVDELLMPEEEVESLLVQMILERRLHASIDQVNSRVLFNKLPTSAEDRELKEIKRLSETLSVTSMKLCIGT